MSWLDDIPKRRDRACEICERFLLRMETDALCYTCLLERCNERDHTIKLCQAAYQNLVDTQFNDAKTASVPQEVAALREQLAAANRTINTLTNAVEAAERKNT